MVLLQNVHVFNCRSETISTFQMPLRRNAILVFGVLAAQGIHLASMYLPLMQNILNVQPVDLRQWLGILALSLVVLVIMEGFKWVRAKV
jgi:magnesium-transporting ATPase (P-type)